VRIQCAHFRIYVFMDFPPFCDWSAPWRPINAKTRRIYTIIRKYRKTCRKSRPFDWEKREFFPGFKPGFSAVKWVGKPGNFQEFPGQIDQKLSICYLLFNPPKMCSVFSSIWVFFSVFLHKFCSFFWFALYRKQYILYTII